MESINMCEKKAYLESISEKELKAYHIAKAHLGDSFQLEKSLGFLDWIKKVRKQDPPSCK